jgi:hypothetical protein
MDSYAENLNNNGLENRWGLVDSARLYLLPTIKGRSECKGNRRISRKVDSAQLPVQPSR